MGAKILTLTLNPKPDFTGNIKLLSVFFRQMQENTLILPTIFSYLVVLSMRI